MSLKKISAQELREVRIAIAASICRKFPNVYEKLYGDKGYVMGEMETLASEVLKAIFELDPCIKRIIEYYFK